MPLLAGGLALGTARAAEVEDFLSHDFGWVLAQPQFDLGTAYTDNLTYTRGTATIADLSTTLSPGLRLRRGDLTGNNLKLEVTHDEVLFLDHTDNDYRQNHFKGVGRYGTGRISLDATETYEQLSGFLGGIIGQGGILNTSPRNRDVWSGTIRGAYDWTEKTQLTADFSHYQTDWAKDVALYDYSVLRGTLGGLYRLTDRIQLSSDVFYGQTGVSANQANQIRGTPSAVYGVFLGVRGQFTTRISGSAKVGFEDRSFFEPAHRNLVVPAFDFDLSYQFGESTAFTLQYSRRTSPSVNFGGQNVTSGVAILGVLHQLDAAGRWSLRGSVTYQLAEYDNSAATGVASNARTDDFYSTEVGVQFRPRPWLKASLGYAFEYYHVDFANPLLTLRNLTGYQANRVFMNLSFGF